MSQLPENLTQVGASRSFGGVQKRFAHASTVLDCTMHFSIYLPPAADTQSVPVLYWLSGLTCTDENFVQKAGAQQYAARHNVAIVAPDTSPRGDHVPDDAEGAWDVGHGAGFYVNATEQPWDHHYRMFDYVGEELPALIRSHFPIDGERCAIMGHSMGGHGALVMALRHAQPYASVSAFAPIVAPSQVPWGRKAFGLYLGDNHDAWRSYDAVELVRQAEHPLPMLVDQGAADGFLEEQLRPELLEAACRDVDYPLTLHRREGYDHSYFHIATFMEEHIRFHVRHLNARS
ncbi:MAG: S-formylglutathione hydrolase [Pseudomonadota bacterium]